jgi:3-oxoacid CoA-transferase subunit B
MDLALHARRVIVAVEHNTRDGKSRIVDECTLPLTVAHAAQAIITEIAVIDVTPSGLVLREVATGVTAEQVQARTDADLDVEHVEGEF